MKAAMVGAARCPFYGFHWPDRSRTLVGGEKEECGLDFDAHGPCRMKSDGRPPNFDNCEFARPMTPLLESAARLIRFRPQQSGVDISFEEWRDKVMNHS